VVVNVFLTSTTMVPNQFAGGVKYRLRFC